MKVTAATGIVASLLVLAAAVVVGALMFWPRAEPERPAPKATAVAPAPPAVKDAVEALKSLTDEVAPQPDRNTGAPAFDVARIEPNGEAVIGGRAAPGATVELLRGGVSHAQTVVGPSGDFVLVPKRLPPGNYDLTLRATQKDGKVSLSKDSVAVALRSESAEKPVVALVAPDKPAVVLSKPETDPTIALAIDAVEGEAGGKLYVSGRAPAGARVRLYLNDAYIASATASAEKRVAFSIQSGIKPGDYRVRLDQVDASGKVQHRAEVPFNAPVAVAAAPAPKAEPPAPKPPQTSDAPTPPPPQMSEAPIPKPDSPAKVAAAPAGSGADTSTAATPPPPTAQKSEPAPPKPEPRETAAAPATPPQSASTQAKPRPSSNNTEIAAAPPPMPAAPQATPAPQSTPAPQGSASDKTETPAPPSLASSEPAASPTPAPKDVSPSTASAPGDRKDVVVVPSVDTTVVIRGDSLWRISRSTYGHGIRYSVIYNANRNQIRDPDLIYPGQIFVLPKEQREE